MIITPDNNGHSFAWIDDSVAAVNCNKLKQGMLFSQTVINTEEAIECDGCGERLILRQETKIEVVS